MNFLQKNQLIIKDYQILLYQTLLKIKVKLVKLEKVQTE